MFRRVLPQSEHFLLGKGGIHPLNVSIETLRPAKLEPPFARGPTGLKVEERS